MLFLLGIIPDNKFTENKTVVYDTPGTEGTTVNTVVSQPLLDLNSLQLVIQSVTSSIR